MKLANTTATLTTKQVQKVIQGDGSKSAKMKTLFEAGMEIKEIATLMDVRYNFVYNVVSNHINMNGLAVEKNNKASKKDEIIKLYLENKSNKEISIELKTNYNYVFNTIKQYKNSLVQEGEG